MNYYHVYNRGAHKAPIFLDAADYHRFLGLLYVANSEKPVRMGSIKDKAYYDYERGATLVDIMSYCLMPNHFHILLFERSEKNLAKFMMKLCTGYSMYYNKRHDHSGTIFQGQYKHKIVSNDEYYRYLIQYIHLNPFSIDEPDLMNMAKSEYFHQAVEYSQGYEYSSYRDYLGIKRVQAVILHPDASAGARVDLAEIL